MCRIMEEMLAEERRETALRMLKAGKYALEEIAEIADLPPDEVRKLQTTPTA